eukprot:scaffold8524_cov200-Skeletonema_marinoi.AAC.1
MRTQNLAAPHGPKSVAFRDFIAAAPYLNPSSQQVPMSSDITEMTHSNIKIDTHELRTHAGAWFASDS